MERRSFVSSSMMISGMFFIPKSLVSLFYGLNEGKNFKTLLIENVLEFYNIDAVTQTVKRHKRRQTDAE